MFNGVCMPMCDLPTNLSRYLGTQVGTYLSIYSGHSRRSSAHRQSYRATGRLDGQRCYGSYWARWNAGDGPAVKGQRHKTPHYVH